MGHLDAFSYVKTDQEFYEKMPFEFRQKSKNFKLSVQHCMNHDYEIALDLNQVKVDLQTDLLTEVSQFIIRGLEKLDLSYASEDDETYSKRAEPSQGKV